MMEELMAICIVGFICLGIYSLFELFVHKKERLLIIEKLSENLNPMLLDGKIQLPSFGRRDSTFTALKIGCLMAGIGAGFLLGFILNTIVLVQLNNDGYLREAAYTASIFLCGGLGLIIAFIIELKYKNKKEE